MRTINMEQVRRDVNDCINGVGAWAAFISNRALMFAPTTEQRITLTDAEEKLKEAVEFLKNAKQFLQ